MFRRPSKNINRTSFPRRRESIGHYIFWIPAFAGMTERGPKKDLWQPPRIYIILAIMIVFFSFANTAFAKSTKSLIDKGNKSWVAGKYDEAIKRYDEAAVDNPESPYIYFNKGTALYKKGDYTAAVEEFEKAALKSKDPSMEAKSRFNLGNCMFREAERQMDSDLKKALENCQKSVVHYQDCLKLDLDFKAAAENIEIVRLYMKNILDEIKKREEKAKQKEQQSQANAQDLQKIIKRQEEALDKNRQQSQKKMGPSEKKKVLDQLADEQKGISEDTQKLTEKIKGQAAQQKQGEEDPALTHLNNAVKEQKAAEGNLRNSTAPNAEKNQENAVKELKDALKPPDQNQDKQGGDQTKEEEQNKQQEKQGQKGQDKDQKKPEDSENPQDQNQPQKEEQAQIQKSNEDAQDILDEERENQKQRHMMSSGGYKDVEKDW